MEGTFFCAPEYISVEGPLIFLAGPVRGGGKWQEKAVVYIRAYDISINIASPYRMSDLRKKLDDEEHKIQTRWESYHLRRAAEEGAILFWLAREREHDCKRAYAQTTRFELGEWKVYHDFLKAPLVVGIEKGFTGERYVRERFAKSPEVPIVRSLEDACEKVVDIARKKG